MVATEQTVIGAPRFFTLALLAATLEVCRPHPPIHLPWLVERSAAPPVETPAPRRAARPAPPPGAEPKVSARARRDALLLLMLVARPRSGVAH